MATPVTLVASGGLPVRDVASLSGLGTPMTPVTSGGMPVTLVDAGGYPVVLVNNDGTLYGLLASATLQLGGIAPYHYWDFRNNRALFASADVGGVASTPGWSYTRADAQTAYAQDSAGNLIPFATGVLRRTDRGVLIEGARTNLCLQSQTFDNASWVKTTTGGTGSVATVTADAGTAPDGTSTADRLELSLNGGTATADISRIRQLITTTAASHTFSVWARSYDGVSTYAARIEDSNGIANPITITGSWQRFAITATAAAGTTAYGVALRGGQSPVNANAADILVWGAQLEASSFPSSYVPTQAASATRAADVLTVSSPGVSYPLSLFAEFERVVDTGGVQTEYLLHLDNGGNNDRVAIYVDTSDRGTGFQIVGGATVATENVTGAIAVATTTKIAGRFGLNDFRIARGGSLSAPDVSCAAPATPTELHFGLAHSGGDASFGYLRRCAVVNSAVNDAGLQSMTL